MISVKELIRQCEAEIALHPDNPRISFTLPSNVEFRLQSPDADVKVVKKTTCCTTYEANANALLRGLGQLNYIDPNPKTVRL